LAKNLGMDDISMINPPQSSQGRELGGRAQEKDPSEDPRRDLRSASLIPVGLMFLGDQGKNWPLCEACGVDVQCILGSSESASAGPASREGIKGEAIRSLAEK